MKRQQESVGLDKRNQVYSPALKVFLSVEETGCNPYCQPSFQQCHPFHRGVNAGIAKHETREEDIPIGYCLFLPLLPSPRKDEESMVVGSVDVRFAFALGSFNVAASSFWTNLNGSSLEEKRLVKKEGENSKQCHSCCCTCNYISLGTFVTRLATFLTRDSVEFLT